MSDDIVTHLRAVANDSVYRADISVSRLEDAVDEIERLRAECEKWKNIAWLGHKVIFSKWEYTQFEQAYEEMMLSE